jgi:hypothetical protein
MAQKRKEESEFKVSDRRLFTTDGDLRESTEEQISSTDTATAPAATAATPATPIATGAEATAAAPAPESQVLEEVGEAKHEEIPTPPTDTEQQVQHDAYKQSSRDLDARVELSGHSAKELEMSFERFMASLYMTAMMQLGLMHEQGGQPGVDLIAEKTKGNLTPKEQGFLQNCLYELRMAYVEVTNALARPPQAPGPITGTHG